METIKFKTSSLSVSSVWKSTDHTFTVISQLISENYTWFIFGWYLLMIFFGCWDNNCKVITLENSQKFFRLNVYDFSAKQRFCWNYLESTKDCIHEFRENSLPNVIILYHTPLRLYLMKNFQKIWVNLGEKATTPTVHLFTV